MNDTGNSTTNSNSYSYSNSNNNDTEAVRSWGWALQYASEELREDTASIIKEARYGRRG